MSVASRLTVTAADGPMPPLVDMMKGVNVPPSTSRIHCSYFLLLSSSCLWKHEEAEDELFETAKALKTFTSKKAVDMFLFQKLQAQTSSLALSTMMALLWWKDSPLSGCRTGSIETHRQTSLRSSANRSLIWLCLMVGKPPLGQLKAWFTDKGTLQAQWDGMQLSGQPYLRHNASRKACLWSLKPSSSTRTTVISSQDEAPLSLACSMAVESFEEVRLWSYWLGWRVPDDFAVEFCVWDSAVTEKHPLGSPLMLCAGIC